jgi:hypothetical protein
MCRSTIGIIIQDRIEEITHAQIIIVIEFTKNPNPKNNNKNPIVPG